MAAALAPPEAMAAPGGNGGTGALFYTAAGGPTTLLNNYGAISGGNGAAGGAGLANGTDGAGGAGIRGANLTVVQRGTGTISGGLSYGGGTRANAIVFTDGANTLTFKDRTDTGITGGINLAAGTASLTLDQTQASSVTIGNAISGSGSVIVNAGTGNVITLTGGNTYTGGTVIDSGTLQVGDLSGTGFLLSGVAVHNTGTLRGVSISTPSISGDIAVYGGGTLFPGGTGETSGHTLGFYGNASFTGSNSGPTPLYANFTATGFVSNTGGISNDLLAVFHLFSGGSLTITGPAQVNLPGVYLPGKAYTIITSVDRSGTFAQYANTDQSTLMKYVTAEVQYGSSGGNAVVGVTPVSDFAAAALTKNQAATATAIDTAGNLGTYGTNGNILLARLIASNSGATAPAALNALSGEGITGQQQTALNASNLFVTAIMDQVTLSSGSGEDTVAGLTGGSAKDAGYAGAIRSAARLWATGFGQQASLNGDSSAGSAPLSSRTAGAAAGADYEATRNFLLGFAGGYSSSNFSSTNRATSGTAEGAHAGLYGAVHSGGFYVAAAGEYAYYDNKTSRTVAYTGGQFDELAKGKFSSGEWLGRVEAGYRTGWALTPFAGFQYATLGNGAFSETSTLAGGGSGVAGLHVDARTANSEKGFGGLQFDTRTGAAGWTLNPYVRVSWEHEFSPNRENTAYLLSLPAASFTVAGASAAQNAARVQTGLKADLTSRAGVFASFDGEFSDRGETYAGAGGVTIRW